MTKSQLRESLNSYIDAVKERSLNGYTMEIPSFEAVALRNAELSGAVQAAESILSIIEESMEEED